AWGPRWDPWRRSHPCPSVPGPRQKFAPPSCPPRLRRQAAGSSRERAQNPRHVCVIVVLEQPDPRVPQLLATEGAYGPGQEREVRRWALPGEGARRSERPIEIVVGETVPHEEDGVCAEERLEGGAVLLPTERGLIVLRAGEDPRRRIDPGAVK